MVEMVANNLPPESQPWARSIMESAETVKAELDTAEAGMNTQLRTLRATLGELPSKISEVESLVAALDVPVSRTDQAFNANLQSMPANTWTEVFQIVVAAPPGKRNVRVVATCIPKVYGQSYSANNTAMYRLAINGVTSTPIVGNPDVLGVSSYVVASRVVTSTTSIIIAGQMLNSNPANIYNNPSNPNYFRTSILAVWS